MNFRRLGPEAEEAIRSGLEEEVGRLMAEGMSYRDAMLMAAATMDGAGEGVTVWSGHTCANLLGEAVPGLTGNDSATPRKDGMPEEAVEVAQDAADGGKDAAEEFLKKVLGDKYDAESRAWGRQSEKKEADDPWNTDEAQAAG